LITLIRDGSQAIENDFLVVKLAGKNYDQMVLRVIVQVNYLKSGKTKV
jgi:hypothetical protein